LASQQAEIEFYFDFRLIMVAYGMLKIELEFENGFNFSLNCQTVFQQVIIRES